MMTSAELASTDTHRLTWSGCRTLLRDHWLRRSEIPLGHIVSLPIPTMRLGAPGFAFFAAAPVREPSQAWRLSPPDRHGVVAADGAALLLYARTSAVPLATTGTVWSTVMAPASKESPQTLSARLLSLEPIMDQAAEAFFDCAPARLGPMLASELEAVVGATVFPFYEALAPDFIAWLMTDGQGATV